MTEKRPGHIEAGKETLDTNMGSTNFMVDYPDQDSSRRRLRRVRRYMTDLLSENQWLLPLAGSVIGVLIALAVGRAGGSPDPDTWAITVGGARNGLLTALSILFAGLSIVLALASSTIQEVVSRFSLRLLRIYLRNPWDKAVIAVFAMAATFILAEWFQLRALPNDTLAPVGGVVMGALLLFISGSMMIWYIVALTSWFRIDRTLRRVAKLILEAAHSQEREHLADSPAAQNCFERPDDAITLHAARSGFLMEVDTQGLLDLAQRYDVSFVIDRGAGRSIFQGEPIGWITRVQDTDTELPSPNLVTDMIGISEVRELKRDVGYGFVVMIDIAIMALSPGINDPNTAVQVIEEMAFLFQQLAQVRLGPVGRTDPEGSCRAAVRAPALGDYIEMATTQILLYGNQDPAVIMALLHLVRVLEGLNLTGRDQASVDTLAAQVQGYAKEMSLPAVEKQTANTESTMPQLQEGSGL